MNNEPYSCDLTPRGNTWTLVIVKGEERYVFLYDDAHKAEALRMLGRFASNPELSFTWYDAAKGSQQVQAAKPVIRIAH